MSVAIASGVKQIEYEHDDEYDLGWRGSRPFEQILPGRMSTTKPGPYRLTDSSRL
jgi:hypothetical protein